MDRRRRRAVGVVSLALLALATGAVSPSVARAEDPAPQDESADAVARLLDATTLRMKALLEEARLLEAAGQRDEALATLRRVGAVYDEGVSLVRALASGALVPRAVPSRDPVSSPTARAVPPAPRPRVVIKKPLAQPEIDPVAGAVGFLLSRQSADGFFRAASGRVGDDVAPEPGHDALTTGLAILALADVVGPVTGTNGAASDVAAARPEVVAIRAAARALAGGVGADGSMGVTPEDHAYAAWGLATAYSRLGDAAWVDPLARAVAHTIATQRPDGSWAPAPRESLDGDDVDGETLLVALAQSAFLHEALPTRATTNTLAMRAAIDRAALLPSMLGAPDGPRAAVPAYDLLRRAAAPAPSRSARGQATNLTSSSDAPARGVDPLFLLYGTVLARSQHGFGDEAEGRQWWERVLVPAH